MGVILNPYISFGSINYTELEWSPADLGANVVRGMWAPYAYPNTVLESSGNVLKIDDVSGNGYHMAVGTNSPNWNSLTKEVEFDHLNTEWMYADMDASTQDVGTLFWVADFGTGSTFGRWFGGPGNDANSTGVTGWAIRSGDSIFRTYYQNTIPLNTPVPSGYFLGSVTVSSTGFESRLNSVSSQTASVTTPTASFTQLKIGQGFNDTYCASLNFRAAVFVQGDLTTDERQRIEGWLAYKCQIQSELPVDHPYRYYIFTDASTILWNPTDLSPTSLRGLWNPYGDVNSVTLSTNDVTSIADLTSNGFDINVGTDNAPNWNNGTVEFDHTNNEWMMATLDPDPSNNVGALFVYAQLGSADVFGRFIGAGNINDSNTADTVAWLVSATTNLATMEGGSQELQYPLASLSGFNLISIIVSDTGYTMRINGTEVDSSAKTGTVASFELLSFGRAWTNSYGASLNLRVAALVEGEMTLDSIEKIEGWIMQEVGDKDSLPVGHSYRFTTFTDPAPSFSPANYDIAWEWKADQSAWTTYTPGGGGNYFISAPNLNAAHTGSANGNEIYSNAGTSGADTGNGWTIEDADKGIKLTSLSEQSIKTRLWDGSSETGLRNGIGPYFELVVVSFTNGYGPSNNFRKDNGWISSKWEGGNRWKHEDIFSENPDGTGGNFNGDITMPFNMTPDGASNKTYLFAHTRDMGDGASQIHPSINADVPGTYADGPKYIQWIQEVTAGGSWSPAVNDSLNESIVQAVKAYTYSPAYVHATAPDTDNTSANTHEYFLQEGTILHMFIYGKKVITTQELSDAYEYAKNFL